MAEVQEDFQPPQITDDIAARAEIEQKNEIVVLDDTDGAWKLDLGEGFRKQWQEITASLNSDVNENDDNNANLSSIHTDTSSNEDTTDITEDKVFIISLLGNTSSGKSFVARQLLECSEENELADGPVCFDEEEEDKRSATTVNINCYCNKLTTKRKTLVLDYEGEKGSAFPLLHFAQKRLAHVSRTAEKAQQRRQAVTDYFPKLAYILSDVVILIGSDDLRSADYLTRCREFAMKANDGVSQMVNPPLLIIIQNKGSLVYAQDNVDNTKTFFDVHGHEAAVLRPYFSDIKCFCLPHRDQIQRTKKGTLNGQEIFNKRMTDMKGIFSTIRENNLEQSLTHAQWLYLLERVLPVVQSGKSVSLHTLLSEITAPDEDKMMNITYRCFIKAYDSLPIHPPHWFNRCCRFAIRIMIHFLAVQNYHRPELLSEHIIGEQCEKALEKLSKRLEEFQPCEVLYTGKGRSSKNKVDEHPIYCFQHKGAHKRGHRTCQSVYDLAPWKEFFGWISTDVWSGNFVASTRNKYKNTIFSENIVKDMPNEVKNLMNNFQQDPDVMYDIFVQTLREEFFEEPLEIFRDICFSSQQSSSSSKYWHHLSDYWELSRVRRKPNQSLLFKLRAAFSVKTFISSRSCSECSHRFKIAWNRPSYRPPSSAENCQEPIVEVSECAVCVDGPRDFLCVPCGHRGFCEKCIDKILHDNRSCPFCRAAISGKQRVHDV